MLKGIHFLLTYKCTSECDHCFLYCSPHAEGTFTLRQLEETLEEFARIPAAETVYFEGGEGFLFYPVLLEGLRLAREAGFKTGLVTNAYWATSEQDAELWLRPLLELGVAQVSISDDLFHFSEEQDNPAKRALAAAKRLGLPCDSICIEKPAVQPPSADSRGEPVIGGGVVLKGRAVEKLTEGLPTSNCAAFVECTEEDLRSPGRVHLDPFGYVHMCQGVVMGNMWKTPLSQLDANYEPEAHPICGPLLRGGPLRLAQEHNVTHAAEYVSACHFCYEVRLRLLEKFPDHLAPPQVYGVTPPPPPR